VIRRLIAAGLIAVGVGIVALGIRTGVDHHRANQVVRTLMEAVERGDRSTALSVLHPKQRARAELWPANSAADDWSPVPGITWRVHHLALNGDRAIARLWVEKQGYVVEPRIGLRRGTDGSWQVDAIDGLTVDPRWDDAQQELHRAANDRLASELSEALEGRPGVAVIR
jgi:hypothetical protein